MLTSAVTCSRAGGLGGDGTDGTCWHQVGGALPGAAGSGHGSCSLLRQQFGEDEQGGLIRAR